MAHRLHARGLLLSLVTLLAACNRTPPEPAPAPTVMTDPSPRPAAASAPARPSRCIAELPKAAPAIPPAAPPSACPPEPEPGAKMATAEVRFPDAPSAPPVEVELAKTPPEVERGLMFRRSMPERHGMFFTLDGRREHTFWMHNTCIPLDMLFVDEDGVIIGIVEGAAPLTDTTRSVGCPSLFVLEVNAGFAREHGILPGQRLTVPSAAR